MTDWQTCQAKLLLDYQQKFAKRAPTVQRTDTRANEYSQYECRIVMHEIGPREQ